MSASIPPKKERRSDTPLPIYSLESLTASFQVRLPLEGAETDGWEYGWYDCLTGQFQPPIILAQRNPARIEWSQTSQWERSSTARSSRWWRLSRQTDEANWQQLEEAQQEHRLERLLSQLDRVELLIVDELGYLSFSRTGAELLFQVFADRYERRSLLITSNLPFGEWGRVFLGERRTAALLDRLTHRCHIFEMNGESYRFRESMKSKKGRRAETT